MRKWIIGIMAAALITLGLVAPASPAAASFSTCPVGQGCIYTDHGGTGTILNVVFSQTVGFCINMGAGMNDKMSSSIETFGSGWHFKFWPNSGCGVIAIGPWVQPDDTEAEWFGSHEDTMSSFRLVQ